MHPVFADTSLTEADATLRNPFFSGSVVQLYRTSDSGSEGPGLESLRSHWGKAPWMKACFQDLGLFLLSDWPVAGEGMGEANPCGVTEEKPHG